jgi:hypothetical protein
MKLKALLMATVGLAVAMTVVASLPVARAQTGPRIGQPAPEITGGPWINSPPLSMDKLRGRVVVVEFWTYG